MGHQAYPHKVLTGRRDQLAHDPQVRRPGPVLLDRRVRARHHGRRPRVDLGVLRGGHQGGHAARQRPGRPGRGGDRRRRAHRRRVLRGAAQRRRPGPPDRDRGQRQRHVDRAERGVAVALLQPHAPQPQALPRARGRRGGADQAARRDRQADGALRADPQGVAQGLLGARAVLRGARPRLRGRDRRPRREGAAPGDRRGARGRPARGGPLQDREGQGLRARRGGRPRGHGEVARGQARLDRQRRRGAGQEDPAPREARRPRRSTRRSSATRWWPRPGATSAWWASPRR